MTRTMQCMEGIPWKNVDGILEAWIFKGME